MGRNILHRAVELLEQLGDTSWEEKSLTELCEGTMIEVPCCGWIQEKAWSYFHRPLLETPLSIRLLCSTCQRRVSLLPWWTLTKPSLFETCCLGRVVVGGWVGKQGGNWVWREVLVTRAVTDQWSHSVLARSRWSLLVRRNLAFSVSEGKGSKRKVKIRKENQNEIILEVKSSRMYARG